MLGLWLAAPRRKSRSTSERAWKHPGSICWRCFGLWIAWICCPLKSHAVLRDTLAALDQLPEACARFRTHLPRRARTILAQLQIIVRSSLDAAETYTMVPGRCPQNG
jgi:hypothetical protein